MSRQWLLELTQTKKMRQKVKDRQFRLYYYHKWGRVRSYHKLEHTITTTNSGESEGATNSATATSGEETNTPHATSTGTTYGTGTSHLSTSSHTTNVASFTTIPAIGSTTSESDSSSGLSTIGLSSASPSNIEGSTPSIPSESEATTINDGATTEVAEGTVTSYTGTNPHVTNSGSTLITQLDSSATEAN